MLLTRLLSLRSSTLRFLGNKTIGLSVEIIRISTDPANDTAQSRPILLVKAYDKPKGQIIIMADLQGRKVFKVFNQDFIVDERYTVTKELGQGAYGIVWYES